ncbi:MAG: DUF3311 domain-containing protein [Desulfitobacteriaceae bacterium]
MIKWLGILPFVAMILAAPLVNRVEPRIFHLPFFLFWITLWIPLSSLILWIVYRFDTNHTGRG